MQRVLMGVVWFAAFYGLLLVLATFVLAVLVSRGLPPDANQQQGMDAVNAFMTSHPLGMSALCWAIFASAVSAAALGTFKRVLPGTRKKV